MAKSGNKYTISHKKMQQLAENWQRCREEELPGLFQAYDAVEKQSERVVTFRLGAKALEALYYDAKMGK
ncbi:MAG: hypothetical protein AAF840_17355, partial [Bacteroidota bacterium]